MKKTLCLLLCMLMMFCFAACGGGDDEAEAVKEYTYEIGMLTAADISIDDKDNVQAAWEGVRQYAEDHELTYKYYEAEDTTAESMVDRVGDAVSEGVKVIVASGSEVSEGIYLAQEKYPEIYFIYLDGVPADKNGKEVIGDNCACFTFNPVQAGFLAGYSAVLEGFNSVAYMADEKNDESVAYGYGFLQGCNEASDWFNRYTFMKYGYFDGKSEKELKEQAKVWYEGSVDAIFTYGADAFDAAYDEAKEAERVVIASNASKDYDKTVITSAMKCFEDIVCEQLDAVYNNTFQGGKSKKMGVKSGGVGLDMDNSRFTYFNKELYGEIIKELGDGNVDLVSVKSADTPEELIQENRLYYIGLYE